MTYSIVKLGAGFPADVGSVPLSVGGGAVREVLLCFGGGVVDVTFGRCVSTGFEKREGVCVVLLGRNNTHFRSGSWRPWASRRHCRSSSRDHRGRQDRETWERETGPFLILYVRLFDLLGSVCETEWFRGRVV